MKKNNIMSVISNSLYIYLTINACNENVLINNIELLGIFYFEKNVKSDLFHHSHILNTKH
ncbi:hypothetical protein SAMN05216324_1249 [Chryseobacterium limigenitum]|uniref:Uncharacterized protein n=1 Tax=Chryseobacterium limigenitum TaxID=1612149 RepID=A0A1K2IW74_9FLAO|nr:hypothetical protein SAMN05216324_1249 [Chryseobacterium limigenitum]